MHTQPTELEGHSVEVAERREFIRYEAPDDLVVTVELPVGAVEAQVVDASPMGGACLVFDEDPSLHSGMVIPVSCGGSSVLGEIRHVAEECGRFRVGVRWMHELT